MRPHEADVQTALTPELRRETEDVFFLFIWSVVRLHSLCSATLNTLEGGGGEETPLTSYTRTLRNPSSRINMQGWKTCFLIVGKKNNKVNVQWPNLKPQLSSHRLEKLYVLFNSTL